jgi:hypothetical protein
MAAAAVADRRESGAARDRGRVECRARGGIERRQGRVAARDESKGDEERGGVADASHGALERADARKVHNAKRHNRAMKRGPSPIFAASRRAGSRGNFRCRGDRRHAVGRERRDARGRALRLTGKSTYAAHTSFPLADYLRLPGKKRLEADLEDLDIADGYLWMVGSHAAAREMPAGANPAPGHRREDPGEGRAPRRALPHRAHSDRCGRRHLDPRAPPSRLDGNEKENALVRALRGDRHLGPYVDLPGKENGLDIEGIAVAGTRVLLGLRGRCCTNGPSSSRSSRARRATRRAAARAFRQRGKRYRKHFLELGGLGIRGLCRHGPDILVLAGCVSSVDGPARLYRWRGGARTDRERQLRPADLRKMMDLLRAKATIIPRASR